MPDDRYDEEQAAAIFTRAAEAEASGRRPVGGSGEMTWSARHLEDYPDPTAPAIGILPFVPFVTQGAAAAAVKIQQS